MWPFGEGYFLSFRKGRFLPPPTWYGCLDQEEMLSERGTLQELMVALTVSLLAVLELPGPQ